jgi:FMN phosphatase YigB (HAD superfamily)
VEPVRVLLFDVFGTLVDWRSSLIGIAEAAAARAGRRAYQPALAGLLEADGPTHLAEALGC